jgi:hypothetical protein
LLWIQNGDEYKLGFHTTYVLVETTVVQFGITNAPADVQGHIKTPVREHLDDFVNAYLDNILVNNNSEEEHVEYNKSNI